MRKRTEGNRGEDELSERGMPGELHQRRLAGSGSVKRQHGLQQGEAQRQRQCEMAEFRGHEPSAFCARRRASAASGGI